MAKTELAWLAGFWDGEGSVGLVSNKATKILSVQLSHTERESIVAVMRILERARINGRGYTYQERDPAKHRDAHYIRISGLGNILQMARLLEPYAVTKKRHWQIAIEWCVLRIKAAGGVDKKGHLKRGGVPGWNAYTDKENKLAEELSGINRRGPRDSFRFNREGRIAFPGLPGAGRSIGKNKSQ